MPSDTRAQRRRLFREKTCDAGDASNITLVPSIEEVTFGFRAVILVPSLPSWKTQVLTEAILRDAALKC